MRHIELRIGRIKKANKWQLVVFPSVEFSFYKSEVLKHTIQVGWLVWAFTIGFYNDFKNKKHGKI